MNIQIMTGKTQLPLSISNEELKVLITRVIEEQMKQKFTCSAFQYSLIDRLKNSGAFKKAPNTEYAAIALTYQDELEINKILWEMIYDRKLILNLLPGTYYATVEMELIKM